MASTSSSTTVNHSAYSSIMRCQEDDLLTIIKVIDIIGFEDNWFESEQNWPGSHQVEKKKKFAYWWDNNGMSIGTIVFLGTNEETKQEMDRLVPPPKEPVYSLNLQTEVADLKGEVNSLKNSNSNLQLELVELRKMAKDYDWMKISMQEKRESCRFVGQHKTRVDYIKLNLALAAPTDLDGFKNLVGSIFGPEFDELKKKARLNYEQFPEKSELWDLMAYLCHCKLMIEEYPDLAYGTVFPEFASSEPSENGQSSTSSPSTPSSSTNKRKNVTGSGGNKRKKTSTPLSERTQKLCTSYARSFTNYYQDLNKDEEWKENKRNKEKERRAKKKLETQKLLAIGNQQTGPASTSTSGILDNQD